MAFDAALDITHAAIDTARDAALDAAFALREALGEALGEAFGERQSVRDNLMREALERDSGRGNLRDTLTERGTQGKGSLREVMATVLAITSDATW